MNEETPKTESANKIIDKRHILKKHTRIDKLLGVVQMWRELTATYVRTDTHINIIAENANDITIKFNIDGCSKQCARANRFCSPSKCDQNHFKYILSSDSSSLSIRYFLYPANIASIRWKTRVEQEKKKKQASVAHLVLLFFWECLFFEFFLARVFFCMFLV